MATPASPRLRDGYTEAFREWFGDSVVMDAQGNALVVYHGTNDGGFVEFKGTEGPRSGGGIFFSSSYALASSYTRGRRTDPTPPWEPDEYLEGGRAGVYEVHLRIEDPLIIDAGESNWDEIEGETTNRDGEAVGYFVGATGFLAREAREMGFDGVIIRNVSDYGAYGDGLPADVYVVFDPNQIKSVKHNMGTFSRTSNDIRKNAHDGRYGVLPEDVLALVQRIEAATRLRAQWEASPTHDYLAISFKEPQKANDPEGRQGVFRVRLTDLVSPDGRPLWVVKASEWFSDEYRRRGLGRLAYEALLRYVVAHGGVMAPHAAEPLGSTSEDAYRVWQRLQQDFGEHVFVPTRSNGLANEFPRDLAEQVRRQYPRLWAKHGTGGNPPTAWTGDDAYRAWGWLIELREGRHPPTSEIPAAKRAYELLTGQRWSGPTDDLFRAVTRLWEAKRERYVSRHAKDFRPGGTIAMIKWGGIFPWAEAAAPGQGHRPMLEALGAPRSNGAVLMYRGTHGTDPNATQLKTPSFTPCLDAATIYSAIPGDEWGRRAPSFLETSTVHAAFIDASPVLRLGGNEPQANLGDVLRDLKFGQPEGISRDEVVRIYNYLHNRALGRTPGGAFKYQVFDDEGTLLDLEDDDVVPFSISRPQTIFSVFRESFDFSRDNEILVEASGLVADAFVFADTPAVVRAAQRLGFRGISYMDVFEGAEAAAPVLLLCEAEDIDCIEELQDLEGDLVLCHETLRPLPGAEVSYVWHRPAASLMENPPPSPEALGARDNPEGSDPMLVPRDFSTGYYPDFPPETWSRREVEDLIGHSIECGYTAPFFVENVPDRGPIEVNIWGGEMQDYFNTWRATPQHGGYLVEGPHVLEQGDSPLLKALEGRLNSHRLRRNPAVVADRTLAAHGLPLRWWHGTRAAFDRLHNRNASGCYWLADRATAEAYARSAYWRSAPERLVEIDLDPKTRVADLSDLSDPVVAAFRDQVNMIRESGWGALSDAEWSEAADFGMLEAYQWARPFFRAKRVDALLVWDVQGHHSAPRVKTLCLLNRSRVVGERDAQK